MSGEAVREAKEIALALIGKLLEVEPAYRALNKAARELQGDFSAQHQAIDMSVYSQVVALIDVTLGDDEIGSYFLNECQTMKDGGAVHEESGRIWPLKTLDDLRAYVMRADAAAVARAAGEGDGHG